jgi:hypothetical protein
MDCNPFPLTAAFAPKLRRGKPALPMNVPLAEVSGQTKGTSGDTSTISPLTPALSPVRGEGEAPAQSPVGFRGRGQRTPVW